MYEQRLLGRRRCVERVVEASNRIDQLIRAGVYDDVLKQTQAVAVAAKEERTLTRTVSDEIVAVLSADQRATLSRRFRDRIVE
jgi:hypothetical protein